MTSYFEGMTTFLKIREVALPTDQIMPARLDLMTKSLDIVPESLEVTAPRPHRGSETRDRSSTKA